jgi:energy-converting hydrogenase A subunit M
MDRMAERYKREEELITRIKKRIRTGETWKAIVK